MTKDNRLGEYLRRTREALGLSIDELAFRSHVRPRLIGGYERGEYKPGADNLTALMAALEVQLPWASADSEESSTAR